MKRLSAGTAARLLTVVSAAVGLLGCAGRAGAGDLSGFGGSPGGCTTTDCILLPVAVPSAALMFEIDPPSNSDAGITVTTPPPLTNGTLQLTADSQTTVTATFMAPTNTTVPWPASAVLTVPSPIPGRPTFTFQGSTAASSTNATNAPLLVPTKMVAAGGMVPLAFIPLPPADQLNPPYTTTVALGATLPGMAPDTFTITGVLETALGDPPNPSFVARAFQGSAQVSNAPLTSSTDGSFQLVLPTGVASVADMGQQPLTIQLTSQSPNDAWFVFKSIPLLSPPPTTLSLGTVRRAAYVPVNQFNVLVEAMADQAPVSGALVQAEANLGTSNSSTSPPYPGTTNFAQTGMTNASGIAAMSLLPNNAYTIVVVPPAGSPYATTCSPPDQPVQLGGGAALNSPSVPLKGPFRVPPRAAMSGKITDADHRPLANVLVAATPGTAPVAGCASTPAAPASTTTDSQGAYTLQLDPGTSDQPVTYQLDYDPLAGTAAPRFTDGVTVRDSGAFTHDVTLPPGSLMTGTVTDSNQALVPSATVRLFEPQCSSNPCSTPPVLRGQAITDANGSFQMVISTQ